MRIRNIVLAAVAALVPASCSAPEIADGVFACGGDGDCPPGFVCRGDDLCYRPGGGTGGGTGGGDGGGAICGDGVMVEGEGCDDGNEDSGDACSPGCVAETAIYVDGANGNDGNPGTQGEPVQTIGHALTLADSATPVFVAGGTYNEQITLVSGVSLRGGFSGTPSWAPDPAAHPTAVVAASPALSAVGIAASTLVQDIGFESLDATSPGTSSIAALVQDSTGLTFLRVALVGGDGAPGVDGDIGTTGGVGMKGGNGSPGCENSASVTCGSCTEPSIGTAGLSACARTGGLGGRAGHGTSAGEEGGESSTGTNGGPQGPPQGDGTVGDDGAGGGLGPHGDPGANIGAFSGSEYTPSDGTDGGPGTHGHGGGGGGGGGGGINACYSYGSSGGGGGGGGCGGGGGFGGTGGGGSFGLLAVGSQLELRDCTISAAIGGEGGDGGDGGGGGPGGDPGLGGVYGGAGEQDDAGNGADGGSGGDGGQGGAGGGGGGGPSIALVCSGTTSVVSTNNQFFAAGGGAGGASDGNPGSIGLTASSFGCSL